MTTSRDLSATRRVGKPRRKREVKRPTVRPKPRRNLVQLLDGFVGLVKRDTQKIEPLKLGIEDYCSKPLPFTFAKLLKP